MTKARHYYRTTDWEPVEDFFDSQTKYYCNEYVAHVLRQSGTATWKPIRRPSLFPMYRQPLAREWSNADFGIKGWSVKFSPDSSEKYNADQILAIRQPGDVVAGNGHVGIVSDDSNTESMNHYLVYSASSKTGAVELNTWSLQLPDVSKYDNGAKYQEDAKKVVSRYTVRRFDGG